MYAYSKGDANSLLEMPTEECKAGIREAAGPGYSSRACVKSVVDRIQGLAGRAVDDGRSMQRRGTVSSRSGPYCSQLP